MLSPAGHSELCPECRLEVDVPKGDLIVKLKSQAAWLKAQVVSKLAHSCARVIGGEGFPYSFSTRAVASQIAAAM